MDDPPSSAPGTPRNGDRLNGWKEIASHFGKSVRTVQRWEKELRLPVHRIHTPNGEIVYALVVELRDWEQQQSSLPDAQPNDVNDRATHGLEAAAAIDMIARRTFRWKLAGLLAATALLAVVVWEMAPGLWRPLGSAPAAWDPQPHSLKVVGDKLRVFNVSGAQVWEATVGSVVSGEYYGRNGMAVSPGHAHRAAIEDVDGDGRNEVLFGLVSADRSNDRLVCYEQDGAKRFEYKPERVPDYDSDEPHPLPMVVPVFVVTAGSGAHKDIWVSFIHNQMFPSVLVKLSPQGERLADEYWSNGHLNVFRESTLAGRRVMLVGGMNNETRGVSLAALDYDKPGGSAPASKRAYRCLDCPKGEPLKFVVFPRSELARLDDRRASPSEMRVTAQGEIIYGALQAAGEIPGDIGLLPASTIYMLSPELELVQAEHEDMYRKMHARHWQAGRLAHKYGTADEVEAHQMLVWNGRSFVSSPPKATPIALRRAAR